jgi:hypothetical protein|tara:strand:+ start:1770 stop:2249 length:480 start_codon:yes stop_codon:yes gene_type:complete
MVMPSKSKKQQDFMAAVSNNPKFAKKAGVPQSVGKDYEKADKMKKTKKFQAGGRMPAGMANPRAGVTGGKEMPTGIAVAPMMPEARTGPSTRVTEGRSFGKTPEERAAARARRSGGGRRSGRGGMKAGGEVYKKGGKVRGAGCATKGTRAAKMVTMKGS